MKTQAGWVIFLVGMLGGCASQGTGRDINDEDGSKSDPEPYKNYTTEDPYYYGSRLIAPKQGVVAFEPAIRPVIVEQPPSGRTRTAQEAAGDNLPPIIPELGSRNMAQTNTEKDIWDRYCTGKELEPGEYEIIDSGAVPERWVGRCKAHK